MKIRKSMRKNVLFTRNIVTLLLFLSTTYLITSGQNQTGDYQKW